MAPLAFLYPGWCQIPKNAQSEPIQIVKNERFCRLCNANYAHMCRQQGESAAAQNGRDAEGLSACRWWQAAEGSGFGISGCGMCRA